MSSKLKQFIVTLIVSALRRFTATRLGKAIFDAEMVRLLETSPKYQQKGWQAADMIYSACRRNLIRNPYWIPGPVRTLDVATKYLDYLKRHDFSTKFPFLDLGCGRFNPLGVSAIFYLNGWDECWALDIAPCDEKRAAEALADLLKEAILNPGRFAIVTDEESVSQRARRFNLTALENGDIRAGLGDISIQYVVSDITAFSKKDGGPKFGTVCSHTVVEHFMQLPEVLKALKELSVPECVQYHYIDFVDHRAYTEPDRYDFWSFLEIARSAHDPLCNKVRCSEMLGEIKTAGFNVLAWDPEEVDLPDGFRNRLHKDWIETSDHDLRTIMVSCVMTP